MDNKHDKMSIPLMDTPKKTIVIDKITYLTLQIPEIGKFINPENIYNYGGGESDEIIR